MDYWSNRQKGFSLLEVLLAISLLGIISMGLFSSLVEYQRVLAVQSERTQGYEYMNQAIDSLDELKFSGVSSYADGVYGLDFSSGIGLSSGSETIGEYTREITLTQIDPETRRAEITVSWGGSLGRSGEVSTELIFQDWEASFAPSCGLASLDIDINTTNVSLSNGNRWLEGIEYTNTNSGCAIELVAVRVYWFGSFGRNIRQVRFDTPAVWAGNRSSGTFLDINDSSITGTHEVDFRFSANMSGRLLYWISYYDDGSQDTNLLFL